MTLPLDNLGGIHDPTIRRNFEIISQQFPVAATGGGGGAPSGPAGGVLGGTYPNPGFAADMATQAELDTHTGLTTTAHGGIVASTDPRLTDARTPTAHKTSHEPGGTDALTGLTNASIAAAAGIAKTKLANLDVVNADVNAAAAIAESKLNLATDAAAATGSRRTLGTTATSAAAGNRGLPAAGTAGQILAKNSATDYDVAWSTPGAASAFTDQLVHMGTVDFLAAAAGTYMLALFGTTTAYVSAAAGTAKAAFYIDAARYAVTGKTTKLSMRATIVTNAVAPTRTFTLNLYPVTSSATASGSAPGVTLGTAVASFTATLTTPAASSIVTATTADVNIPASGLYVMAVTIAAGAMAAGSAAAVSGQLFARFV